MPELRLWGAVAVRGLLLRVLGAGNVSREMRAAFEDRLLALLGSRH